MLSGTLDLYRCQYEIVPSRSITALYTLKVRPELRVLALVAILVEYDQ